MEAWARKRGDSESMIAIGKFLHRLTPLSFYGQPGDPGDPALGPLPGDTPTIINFHNDHITNYKTGLGSSDSMESDPNTLRGPRSGPREGSAGL